MSKPIDWRKAKKIFRRLNAPPTASKGRNGSDRAVNWALRYEPPDYRKYLRRRGKRGEYRPGCSS